MAGVNANHLTACADPAACRHFAHGDLESAIAAVVAGVDFGRATARRGGRSARWPWLPVIIHADGSGVAAGADRQETITRRAFVTRHEAMVYAAQVIEARRQSLADRLARPHYRALREQYGLPREVL